jgi:crotonobetainyl-CoA:carnitine CoA-transferase CaiB-like acyl-CoA transferase
MIGLSREFIDDSRDPAATKAAIAGIIAGRSADEWRPLFAAADCCVTIMATLEEALRDPHFVERGLFAHQVAGPTGATMPALPVPINPQFRADPRDAKSVPKLSE